MLTKEKARTPHDCFAYYLDNQLQAYREGKWKVFLPQADYPLLTTIMYTNRQQVMQRHFALRDNPSLYDLETDIGEANDLANTHPRVLKHLLKAAREFDQTLKTDQRAESLR